MNIKRIWLIIPATLFPYLILFSELTVAYAWKCPFFHFIETNIIHGNYQYLTAAIWAWYALSVACIIIAFVTSIRREWDALSLAKTAMIVKLIQVPAYIGIFVLGVLFAISIILSPISLTLYVGDCLALLLSSLLTVSAVINSVRQKKFRFIEVIWIICLQTVFCADVIASTAFYMNFKKRKAANYEKEA